eukprot:6204965-Pleurochrysis_carterae.AAC.1
MLSAAKTANFKCSAAHLDQGLGHTVREVAFHICYLNTLCKQLANLDFGYTAQGRRLLACSVLRQTLSLCHSIRGAQLFRAEDVKLFAKGRRGERSLTHLQRELQLGYAHTPASQAATSHPICGGLHLPHASHRPKSLSALPLRHQCRKLVAVPDPERQFVHSWGLASVERCESHNSCGEADHNQIILGRRGRRERKKGSGGLVWMA